jgi:hypothetical protein
MHPRCPQAKSKDFKIAIVNDVNYHHEVTAGVIWALRAYLDQVTVYLDQEVSGCGGGAAAVVVRCNRVLVHGCAIV